LNNPLTSNNAGIQKALYVLEVLKGLPAGDVIYQQIEQILNDIQDQQSEVERTYHVISHALLDAYIQHLNPASPLYVQASILQRRLQPPIWSSDLSALRSQVDVYSDHILSMHDIDKEKLQASLSPLLQTPGSKKQQVHTDEPTIPMTVSTQEMEQEIDPRDYDFSDSAFKPEEYNQQENVHNEITTSDEPDVQNHSLDSKEIEETISQNQQVSVVLDLLATELLEMEQKDGVEPLRDRMQDLVNKLKDSQGDLLGNMRATIDYITNAAGDRSRLDEELKRVRKLSMTDELTGLPNRRAFLDRLENELGRVKRHHEPLSLILIDLDDFKKVNDTYGHAVGDQVLKCYAKDVFSLFRQYDLVARYGGEEFAVLSPNTDMEGAVSSLGKAMDRVKNMRFEFSGDSIMVPSFSAGIAVYRDGENIDAFIDRADQALYRAKSLGRNRVETAAG